MSDSKTPKHMPDDVVVSKCKEKYELGLQYYGRDHRRMRMLDQTDNGDLWRAIGSKFPPYQILPDTNQISYVKDNLLASLYTTAKSAEVRPTSDDDKELCVKLSIVLDNFWSVNRVGFIQFQAGERAALLNLGVTQVGWDENVLVGKKGEYRQKGQVVLKNINPMRYMRDPFSNSIHDAGWCCTWDRLHKSVIMADSKYHDEFKKYLDEVRGASADETQPNYGNAREANHSDDHFTIYRFWVRCKDGKINEYHIVNFTRLLYKNEDIKPAQMPFCELYCNLPSAGLVGVSNCAKIFANNVAYNLMNSLALTAEYKNQRPPKFVSAQSGLNIPAFTKHGAEADRTFVVQQNAQDAVHYHQFPPVSPQLPNLMQNLNMDIQNVSGVDQRYTGRDTGSIITTGGTEEMLNRVTMIDTPKIVNYENYTRDLTELILKYMLEFSPKRKYFIQKPGSREYESIEVDFPKIDKETLFEYDIEISSELPKNKQRVAAWADMIMEKQMQYREGGGQVELITEEEWLMFQDIPFKEMMLERMGFQRDTNAIKETSQVLLQYANLVENGMSPEDALMMTAQTLQGTRQGQTIQDAEQAGMEAMGMPPAMGMAGTAAAPPQPPGVMPGAEMLP